MELFIGSYELSPCSRTLFIFSRLKLRFSLKSNIVDCSLDRFDLLPKVDLLNCNNDNCTNESGSFKDNVEFVGCVKGW